jgi:hypothetical protein
VFLRNAHRFERYEGPKNEVAKSKLFARLSNDLLDWYSKLTDTPIDTLHKSEIITHKSEINQITDEVFEALENDK